MISSVSGGSFTAAYYALYHDQIFQDFAQRYLYDDVQGNVIGSSFNPLNWPRLMSPTFDRIDLAAEYYDRQVFDHRTYADLVREKERPYLLLNASDVSLGSRFEFTQEQFDFLYSDLGSGSPGTGSGGIIGVPSGPEPDDIRELSKGSRFCRTAMGAIFAGRYARVLARATAGEKGFALL